MQQRDVEVPNTQLGDESWITSHRPLEGVVQQLQEVPECCRVEFRIDSPGVQAV